MTPQELASAFGPYVERGGKYYVLCPCHADTEPSLCIEASKSTGKTIWFCQPCGKPGHAAITEEIKRRYPQFFSSSSAPAHPKQSVKPARKQAGRVIAEYDYQGSDGKVVYQTVRFDPKDFRQRRRDPENPDKWIWNLKGVELVLFRLPELLAAPLSVPVIVVEGEKDVLALVERGYLATTNPMGAGKWRKQYTEALRGRDVVIVADADERADPKKIAGAMHGKSVCTALDGIAKSVRVTQVPEPHKDVSDWIAAGAGALELKRLLEVRAVVPGATGRKIVILVDSELPRVVTEMESALIEAPDQLGFYQRGGRVVRIRRLETMTEKDGIKKHAGTPQIEGVPAAAFRDSVEQVVQFWKMDGRLGRLAAKNCPREVSEIYLDRAEWRLRPLAGVIDCPTLRTDGSILQSAGYDDHSGMLLMLDKYPQVPENPGKEEALDAMMELCYPFRAFPFVTEAAKSVLLSAILTACVRQAISTAPLHGFTAPTPASGKSKLADCVSLIAQGRKPITLNVVANPEEEKKRLFALLMDGARVILYDNVTQPIDSDSLCTALTQTEYSDRILGSTKTATAYTAATFMASGNNLTFRGDMIRRALLCTIDPQVERPEERRFDFDAVAECLDNRKTLVVAALTALRAFRVEGMPIDKSRAAFGGFEAWSNWIRGTLLWLGYADPVDTRKEITGQDDVTSHLSAMLSAWYESHQERLQSVADAMREPDEKLKAAIENVAEDRKGGINAKRLGKWLAKHDGRILNGMKFMRGPSVADRATWRVVRVGGTV